MILSQQGSAEWISNQFLGGLVGSSMLSIMLVVTAFGLFIHFLVPVATRCWQCACHSLLSLQTRQESIPCIWY